MRAVVSSEPLTKRRPSGAPAAAPAAPPNRFASFRGSCRKGSMEGAKSFNRSSKRLPVDGLNEELDEVSTKSVFQNAAAQYAAEAQEGAEGGGGGGGAADEGGGDVRGVRGCARRVSCAMTKGCSKVAETWAADDAAAVAGPATGRVRRRSKDLTAEGVSVARTLRRCSEGSLRSSFESDTSEMAPPNSSEGGGRDEEMGV